MESRLLICLLLSALVGVFCLPLVGCNDKSEPLPSTPTTPSQIVTEPSSRPATTPKPEYTDNLPIITDYSIPESVICGDEIKVSLEAIDDVGLDSIFINVETNDGTQDIPLNKKYGSLWECAYITETSGSHIITAKIIDNQGQELVEELGIVKVKEDNPPKILSVEFPSWIELNDDFEIMVKAADDRGISEVKVTFTKQGNPVDEIALEQNSEGVFTATYNSNTYGPIDYLVTVTDNKGQTANEAGEIFCENESLRHPRR